MRPASSPRLRHLAALAALACSCGRDGRGDRADGHGPPVAPPSVAARVALAREPCDRRLRGDAVVRRLATLLDADDALEVRLAAAGSLECLGPDAAGATWALIRAIAPVEPPILRVQALHALRAIGRAAAPALPAVQRCAGDADASVRDAALECELALLG